MPTGSEEHIRDGLAEHGFAAFAPTERVELRRGGAWHEVVRVLMPGYVFVGLEAMTAEVWHRIITACRFLAGRARFLGDPTPITEAEARTLRFLAPDAAPLEPSVVEFDAYGTPHIVSGPLVQLSGRVTRFERRQRRARVRMTLLGDERSVSMGIVTREAKPPDDGHTGQAAAP